MLYLTLRQYEYIVAVAEAGGMSDAAARVGISQPSLSVAVKQVEDRLEETIFLRRRGAKIEITPFGHRFIRRARALLAQAERVERSTAQPEPFVLGCLSDVAPWHLAPALDGLRDALPGRQIKGVEGRFSDLAEGLATGRLDLAITYDIGFDARFERRTLQRILPVAFMSVTHPLASRPSIDLSDLRPYPLILYSEPESESFMKRLLKTAQVTPETEQRVASLELMRSLAAHGLGVGLSYSRPPGRFSYDGKELATVAITTPAAEAELKLVWSRHASAQADLKAALQALS